MNNKIVPFLCLIFLISLNLFFRWPVENGRLTSTFGESRGDHFHDGIDVISGANKIYPVAEGELVYFWDKSIFPLENYPGGGNYRILKHGGNIYSIYMHIAENSDYKDVYSKKESLGSIGNTGHSSGRHLHFSLLNLPVRKSINPFIFLPEYTDNRKPLISDVYISVDNRYYLIKNKSSVRLTRNYPLLVKIVDSARSGDRFGVFRLKVIFNNKKALDINFSEIIYSKNGLTIGGKTFHDLFDEKGYYKINNISYIEGLNRARIYASDYSGNETIKEIIFQVKLDVI